MNDPRDDRELLVAHVAGDPTAFSLIVSRHQHYLYAVAVGIMRNPEDGADVLQEALVNAFRKADTYEGRGATVQTWLRQVTRNACLDRLRQVKARPRTVLAVEDQAELASTQNVSGSVAASVDVAAALRTLPAGQRDAVVLVDCYGWSVDDAANRLGIAPGTVKSRCSRAREALRAQLYDGWGAAADSTAAAGRPA